jgi:pimeloyl-ACP methyl ester carboxylesterase
MVPESVTVPERFRMFLDRRRRTANERRWRVYAGLDDLVERRKAQNPRLSKEWLRYFAFFGARRVEDGWIWKADPLCATGFAPFKTDWIGRRWKHLHAPLLAMIGSEPDTWGPIPEETRMKRLANAPVVEHVTVEGAGHFVHMEQPRAVADVLLAFLER